MTEVARDQLRLAADYLNNARLIISALPEYDGDAAAGLRDAMDAFDAPTMRELKCLIQALNVFVQLPTTEAVP